MKKTGKAWIFFILEIIFLLIIPCVLVWLQYGELCIRYKISVTAILLIALIYWIFKRILIDKWLKTIDIKIVNIETNSLSIIDDEAISTNKKAWQTYSILQLVFNSIIPILVMVLAIITIKTVESGLIKLFGCLMFCLISIIIGVIFRICEIYSMKLIHEKERK